MNVKIGVSDAYEHAGVVKFELKTLPFLKK